MDLPKLPTLNGETVGEDQTITVPKMPDDVLRKMNHSEWLQQFATVLNMKHPGREQPMTPFRAGAISRLHLARQYIELLEHENKMYRRKEKQNGDEAPASEG